MQFSEPLDALLGQQSKVRILRFLFKSQVELTGREIARNVGLSHPKCHLALKELSEQGVVVVRRVGKSILYRLNDESLFAQEVLKPLFGSERGFILRVPRMLMDKLSFPVASMVLFGSVAQGKERPDSDIDLLMLIEDDVDVELAESEIDEAGGEVVKAFGNRLAPVILKVGDFCERYKKGDKLIGEMRETGKVIYGRSLMEVLSSGGKEDTNKGR